ncbi:hypothetical protein H4R33_003172 [Dimargaris cristalligena]|uniref:Bromo domain-containing protein n=1 Tax=Dimargaris cristalligena TaxID=215637 RepID=A0A4P9ZQC9_9FUNG|nr:hypothetical protein H4R33_003172 [Dimargaris cristalligena]RKP34931.1 hypothetical protein BJ085DRAFT_34994 [Dimargaris cristalligena]|eukprot:RKP34931.1 hypothetical protein BJ085DRAFT_34994 [Dimargaris cristalligena]
MASIRPVPHQDLKQESVFQSRPGLFPVRYDWLGKPHPQSYTELVRQLPHVTPSHLLDLLISATKVPALGSSPDPTNIQYSLTTLLGASDVIHPSRSANRHRLDPLARLRLHGQSVASPWPVSALKSYEELVSITGHRFASYCVAFDATGLRLITGSDDFLVKIFCSRTGYLINTLRGQHDAITDMAINSENSLLATSANDGVIRVYSLRTGVPVVVFPSRGTGSRKTVTSMLFSPSPIPEARYLLAAGQDGHIRLWPWSRRHLTFATQPHIIDCRSNPRDSLQCAAFNQTGSHFAVSGTDRVIRIFSTVADLTAEDLDISARRSFYEARTTNTNASPYPSSSTSRRGSSFKSMKSRCQDFPDDHLEGRRLVAPKLVARLEGHTGDVSALLYAHSGNQLMSSSVDGTARIWSFDHRAKSWSSIALDMRNTRLKIVEDTMISLPPGSTPTVVSAQNLDPVPESVAGTTREASVETTGPVDSHPPGDESTTARPTLLSNKPFPITMAIWSIDDNYAIVAAAFGTTKVFNAITGEVHAHLKGHADEVFVVDTHPFCERLIMTAGYDGRVILWDIVEGTKLREFIYPEHRFLDGRFSQDGHQFAVTDDSGTCILFGLGFNPAQYVQSRQFKSQMFLGDYAPTQLDTDLNVVDAQSQIAPHLMPKGPVMDFDGREYAAQKPAGYGLNFPIQPTSGVFEQKDLGRLMQLHHELDTPESEELVTAVIACAPVKMKRAGNISWRGALHGPQSRTTDADPTEDAMAIEAPIYPLPDDEDDEDFEGSMSGGESGSEASESQMYGRHRHGFSSAFVDDEAMEDNGFDHYDDDERGHFSDESISGHLERHRSSTVGRSRRGFNALRQARSTRYSEELDDADSISNSSGSESYSHRGGRNNAARRAARLRRGQTHLSYHESSDSEPVIQLSDGDIAESNAAETEVVEDSAGEAAPTRFAWNAQIYTDSEADEETPASPPTITTSKRRGKQPQLDSDSEAEDIAGPSTKPEPSGTRPNGTSMHLSSSGASTAEPSLKIKVNLRERRAKVLASDGPSSGAESEPNHPPKAIRVASGVSDVSDAGETDKEDPILNGGRTHGQAKAKSGAMESANASPISGLTSWVSDNDPHIIPYKPQIGDLVAYFPEGHREFLQTSPLAQRFQTPQLPWRKYSDMGHTVFGQVLIIKYHVGPPTWCSVTIQAVSVEPGQLPLDPQSGLKKDTPDNASGDPDSSEQPDPNSDAESADIYTHPPYTRLARRFKVEFHDTDSCPDFIVLLSRYRLALGQSFAVGDSVMALFTDDETYRAIIIEGKGPSDINSDTDSSGVADLWQQWKVQWCPPSQSPEWLSPWELLKAPEPHQPLSPAQPPQWRSKLKIESDSDGNDDDDGDFKDEGQGITRAADPPASHSTSATLLSPLRPNPAWERMPAPVVQKLVDLVETFADMPRYDIFVDHVDLAEYPYYTESVAYPMCLSAILDRLQRNFYRHVQAVEFDVKLISEDAHLFNKPHTPIPKLAKKLVGVFGEELRTQLRDLLPGHSNGGLTLDWNLDEYDESSRGRFVAQQNGKGPQVDTQDQSTSEPDSDADLPDDAEESSDEDSDQASVGSAGDSDADDVQSSRRSRRSRRSAAAKTVKGRPRRTRQQRAWDVDDHAEEAALEDILDDDDNLIDVQDCDHFVVSDSDPDSRRAARGGSGHSLGGHRRRRKRKTGAPTSTNRTTSSSRRSDSHPARKRGRSNTMEPALAAHRTTSAGGGRRMERSTPAVQRKRQRFDDSDQPDDEAEVYNTSNNNNNGNADDDDNDSNYSEFE